MDTQQRPSSLKAQLPQAQLWIGSHDNLVTRVHELLQQRWCPHHGCQRCTTCMLITQHQYHGAVWIKPDSSYTREDLEPIFHAMQFTVDEHSELLFIIQKADYLTPACYNSLLKSLEEPPHGYYFILLSNRLKEVAPTIRSRCQIHNFSSEISDIRNHPLALHFIACSYESPINFMQTLEQTAPTEHETQDLLDAIFAYWISNYMQAVQEQNNDGIATAVHVLTLLEAALEEPPMAGSSKLFWKNLFLQFKL